MSRPRLEFSVLTHTAAKWPLPGKVLLGCALAGVVLLVGDLVYLSPSRERLREVEVQEVSLQQQLAEKTLLAADLEGRTRQFQLTQEKVGGLLQQMPGESEMPGFLEDIARMALANGLVIESVAPLDKLSRPFYNEQPVHIGATGTYHDLAMFVSALGGLPRIITVHDVALRADAAGLRLELVANKAYWDPKRTPKLDKVVLSTKVAKWAELQGLSADNIAAAVDAGEEVELAEEAGPEGTPTIPTAGIATSEATT